MVTLVFVTNRASYNKRIESRQPIGSDKVYIDSQTRIEARNIKASQVDSIRLEGNNMGIFWPNSIIVKNPELIDEFLNSLKNATTNSKIGIGNGVNGLRIFFKPVNGRPVEPKYFAFNPQYTDLWYGPKFKVALNKLSKYQAEETRRRAERITLQQLKAAKFGAFVTTDKQTLARLLTALRNVDATAFNYTAPMQGRTGNEFKNLSLSLSSNRNEVFHFLPVSTAPNTKVEPLWRLYSDGKI